MSENQEESLLTKILEKQKSKTKPVLAFLSLFFLLIILSFFSSRWYRLQAIKNVKISGNNILANSEIYDLVTDEIIGVSTSGIDLIKVKQKLESHPYIYKATVWFNSKGILGIEINERYPTAIVIKADGSMDLVDNTASIMPYRLHKEFTNFPIISNVYSGKNINKAALLGALLIINEMGTSQPTFSQIISEIKYIPEDKSYKLYLSDSGLGVLFGRPDDIVGKLENLSIFWREKLLVSKFDREVRELDVRWKDLVIAKY